MVCLNQNQVMYIKCIDWEFDHQTICKEWRETFIFLSGPIWSRLFTTPLSWPPVIVSSKHLTCHRCHYWVNAQSWEEFGKLVDALMDLLMMLESVRCANDTNQIEIYFFREKNLLIAIWDGIQLAKREIRKFRETTVRNLGLGTIAHESMWRDFVLSCRTRMTQLAISTVTSHKFQG